MQTFEGQWIATGFKFAFVVSRFNELITANLLQGAIECFQRNGGEESHVTVVKVPGAFEIPLAAQQLALSQNHDAIVCLGAVIRGATPHFDYVCAEVAGGIGTLTLQTQIPITFGILTTDTLEQALERAGSKAGNKGTEATLSAIEMVSLLKKIPSA